MANRRNKKKFISYVAGDMIDAIYLKCIVDQGDTTKATALIGDIVDFADECRKRICHSNVGNHTEIKQYFAALDTYIQQNVDDFCKRFEEI